MFGKTLLSDFSFRENFINLNNGSFGSCPRVVRDEVYSWHAKIEEDADYFLRIKYVDEMRRARIAVSEILHVDEDELALVTNATTGMNVILRSLKFEEGDTILHFSTVYGSVGNTIEWLCDHSDQKIKAQSITLGFPIPHKDILTAFEDALKANSKIKLAVFDHVISLPGVKMPWLELIQLCKQYNVYSLVDGAHGIGLAPLDLHQADPDFFTSNCHKWLHCMRSCAVLYVPKRHQHLVHAMPTTHGYVPERRKKRVKGSSLENLTVAIAASDNQFIAEFDFPATIDFAPYFAISAAIAYRKSIGGEEAIMNWCNQLVDQGGALVAQVLGTEVMPVEEKVCMTNVRLPIHYKLDSLVMTPPARTIWIFKECSAKDLNVSAFAHNETWWVRLSAQVFNDLSDFEYAAEVLKEVCARCEQG